MTARDLWGTWLLALVASIAVGTHGIAYWDAGDYVRLALEGGVSGLLLGRPLFLWISRAIVTLVDPSSAEPVLRFSWTAIGATAAPLLGLLGVALGMSRRAALAAALALALSPSFAHTAHQVLTDAPALALSLAALLAAARGRALLAGILLACAIATRETSVVHAIGVAMLLRRRSLPAFGVALFLLAVIVYAAHGRGASLAAWFTSMRGSSTAHPLSARDVSLSLLWIVAAGPLPIALGVIGLRRAPRIVLPAAAATALLVLYPDGSFSPRYVLATAPLLFLAAGVALARRPKLAAIALIVPLALVPLATARTRAIAERGRELAPRIALLPERMLLVPGHYCPHARLALAIERAHLRRATGASPPRDVTLLCPGWDWPADPRAALDAARAARTVAIDASDDAWVGPRELAPRDAVRAWIADKPSRALAGFLIVTPPGAPALTP